MQGIRFLSLDWGAWRMDNYVLVLDSYNWLSKQLQNRTPTVIFTHHPPVHVGVEMFDSMTPPDLYRLQDLIAPSSVLGVFHGHTHYPWENKIGQIPVFGTGSVTYRRCLHQSSSEESILEIHPPQYRVVTIGDDGSVRAPICEVPLGA
jgi:predicted phosphodiesterase